MTDIDISPEAVERIAEAFDEDAEFYHSTDIREEQAEASAVLRALRSALTASEKDAERMQYLEDEPVRVEVSQSALADTGDYDVCIAVIENHMDSRHDKILGTGATWREAIDNARGAK